MATPRWQWFSSNPDKAWAERFFVAQSPLWMIAVALAMFTGWMQSWSELGYLLFGCATMLPAVLGPPLLLPSVETKQTRPPRHDRAREPSCPASALTGCSARAAV